jgi:hypothetical protein
MYPVSEIERLRPPVKVWRAHSAVHPSEGANLNHWTETSGSEHRMTDKVYELNNPERYTPSPEPFRTDS